MMTFFQDLNIRAKIIACAVIILVIVVTMSAVVYNGIVVSQARDREVAYSNELVNTIDELQLQIYNIEIGYRGFLIVGDEAFLESYNVGYEGYTKTVARLRELVNNDAEQFERLEQVDQAVQGWRRNVVESGIAVRKMITGDPNAPITAFMVADNAGQLAFDDLRNRISAFRVAEIDRSNARRQEAQAAAQNLQMALLAGTLLAMLSSLSMLWLLATNIARRIGQVTRAATQMAEGSFSVRCNLPAARDEVGQLAVAFDTMAAIIEQRTGDLHAQYAVADTARREAEAAQAQIAEQLAVIKEQQDVIREMSVPVLPLTHTTAVMPLIGALDSAQVDAIHTQALRALELLRLEHLILDITGVPVVDTSVAQGLLQLVQMAELMGVTAIIVGIRPEVAQAVISLGLDLSQIRTFSSLQQGIVSLLEQNALVRLA